MKSLVDSFRIVSELDIRPAVGQIQASARNRSNAKKRVEYLGEVYFLPAIKNFAFSMPLFRLSFVYAFEFLHMKRLNLMPRTFSCCAGIDRDCIRQLQYSSIFIH